MALSINTNISAMQAQRFLSMASSKLGENQERLSSGLRLNSAADDAAGVAISARMTAQINGMNQAARNANDAISMVQTAESGLKRIEDLLNEMRVKAVQSANETNTGTDRSSLDDEYQQKLEEIDRIAREQSFNGLNLLDGSRGNANYQIGPDTDSVDSITVDMGTSVRTNAIGARYTGNITMGTHTATATDGGGASATPGVAANELEINGVGVNFTMLTTGVTDANQGKTTNSAWGIAKAINDNANISVEAEAQALTTTGNNKTITLKVSDSNTTAGSAATAKYTLNINGVQILATSVSVSDTNTSATATKKIFASTIADAINAKAATLGMTADVTDASGKLQLKNTFGGYISVSEKGTLTGTGASAKASLSTLLFAGAPADTAVTGSATTFTNVHRNSGTFKLIHTGSIKVNDTAAGDEFGLGASGSTSFTSQTISMSATKITSVSDAQAAIDRIDEALEDVDVFRAELGAVQNRFESTIKNLEASAQNLSDARARIQDADIAKQASEMMLNNVRKQAASAVLAQANQNPQLALQLLGG